MSLGYMFARFSGSDNMFGWYLRVLVVTFPAVTTFCGKDRCSSHYRYLRDRGSYAGIGVLLNNSGRECI